MSKRELNDDIIICDRLNDADYVACIKARGIMEDPCRHITEFGDVDMAQSCWGGHILNQYYGKGNGRWPRGWVKTMDRIASKLGFAEHTSPAGAVYIFNDTHEHRTVLEEFDWRMENWPNGYKG